MRGPKVPKVKKTVPGAGRTVQRKNKNAKLIFLPQTHTDCRRQQLNAGSFFRFQNGQDSSFEGYEIREILFQDAHHYLSIDFVVVVDDEVSELCHLFQARGESDTGIRTCGARRGPCRRSLPC